MSFNTPHHSLSSFLPCLAFLKCSSCCCLLLPCPPSFYFVFIFPTALPNRFYISSSFTPTVSLHPLPGSSITFFSTNFFFFFFLINVDLVDGKTIRRLSLSLFCCLTVVTDVCVLFSDLPPLTFYNIIFWIFLLLNVNRRTETSTR